MTTYYVYALVKPDDFRPFYIGATNNLSARRHRHKERWRDERFDLMVIAECAGWEEAGRLERETIGFYIGRGVALRNSPTAPSYSPLRRARWTLEMYSQWCANRARRHESC